jgi:roadblock/LC7 domain-containing protein
MTAGGAAWHGNPGNLKNKQVEKLIRAGKPGNHYDGRGLRLEIKGPNSASWVTRYQIDGVVRYVGPGSSFDFTLAEARARNRKLVRQKIADGTDPVLARRAEHAAKLAAAAKAMTFAEACRQYLAQHGGKWESPKHRKQWAYTLATYAEPVLGALSVADIDVPLVLKALERPVPAARGYAAGPLWETRPETGNRLRGRIESVLDYCKARGHRSGENPAAWDVIGKVPPSAWPEAAPRRPALQGRARFHGRGAVAAGRRRSGHAVPRLHHRPITGGA